MTRGKYEAAPKAAPITAWILVVMVLLGTLIGGAAAYLSASTEAVSNRFVASQSPELTVQADNSIHVKDPGYGLYLRGNVIANWVNVGNGNILAQIPVEGTDYELSMGTGWAKHNGFYYYKSAICEETTTSPMVTVTTKTAKTGYQLVLKVTVQTVQSVGQTDADPAVNAVVDAWGVQPDELS